MERTIADKKTDDTKIRRRGTLEELFTREKKPQFLYITEPPNLSKDHRDLKSSHPFFKRASPRPPISTMVIPVKLTTLCLFVQQKSDVAHCLQPDHWYLNGGGFWKNE